MEDTTKCGKNFFTGAEKREWAIAQKEARRDKGLVDGLRFKTEEESAEYLCRREEEDAKHRPGQQLQTAKKRTSFASKAEFKDRDVDFEKQKVMVAAMSRNKAQQMVRLMKKKYAGCEWPKDVCRLYGLLNRKAITVESMPLHPSALAMYADGNDPREGSGVVSAGRM